MIEITVEYLESQGLSPTFAKRFFSKVKKTESCWLWTGATQRANYGCLNTGYNRVITASRASWILHKGPIPQGMHVLHNCPNGDNPSCVNPAHLWLGKPRDNMNDKIRKGRQLYGEQIGNHKLTQQQVDEVRRLYSLGSFTMQNIADIFGISLAGTFKIIRHHTWNGRPHGVPNTSPVCGFPKTS